MAVDKSYGSGNKNTGMKKPVAPKAASAKLRKGGVKAAAKKYTSITTSKAKMLPGTSDYVAQENAARKQLGVAGLAARNRQLPAAARATARGLVREITGVDVSRKGIKVNPLGLAMALPVGKVLKAARVLQTAGRAAEAAPLFARVAAKVGGRVAKKASAVGNAGRGPFSMKNSFKEQSAVQKLTGRNITSQGARAASESVFPKLPNMGYVPGATRTFDRYADPLSEGAGRIWPGIAKRLPKPNLPKGRNVSDATVNIVDTRRMNPAQAKSALEKGVNQTATFKRGVPSKPKKINKVTRRLLEGR